MRKHAYRTLHILLSLTIVLIFFLPFSLKALATTYITYYANTGFENLRLTGNASLSDTDSDGNKEILLTNNSGGQSGAAFFTTKIKQVNGFSSFFKFYLSSQNGGGADGIVFIIAADTNALGSEGGGMGYEGIGSSVGIEFDTYDNAEVSNSHIGIDLNGNLQSDPVYNLNNIESQYFHNNTNSPYYGWVDYNGTTLRVYVSRDAARPSEPQLSKDIDLSNYCGDEYYVGFTAATGGSSENHIIDKWYFLNSYEEGGLSESGDYAVDSTPPTAPAQSLDGTTVSFSSSDDGSGVNHYEYRYSESEDWTEGGSADISGKAFPVTVYARAIDNVGNISEISTETYHSSQLTNLLLSTSSLSPAFDPATLAYTTTVTNATESISLEPVAKDATAAILINGTAVSDSTFSGAIPLSVGDNIITVEVTAQDASSSTTYTLAVTRNAVLSEPTVNTYSGMYDGSAHTFSVESDTEGVEITYTTEAYGTSETAPSFTEPGTYEISYTLTKEGYDDYTGSGTLEIQPSTDATLSALHLSVNTADYAYTPEFASDTDVYAATVDYAVTEIELLPVTTDAQASYTINGTAVSDLSSVTTVSLAEGKNKIPIEVTAQSGVDKKTYTLYVLRKEETGGAAAPSNYYIAGGVFNGTAPYTISLMDGSTTAAETTSSSGEFVFDGLSSGVYNLSIKDSSSPVKSMIVKQTITDQNITDAKYIFPTGDVNSSLEVSANTPKVKVGNLMEEALEHEASGSQVDLTLTVSAESADGSSEQTAIEGEADGRTLLYLEITVNLKVDSTETPLTSTNKVLEIIIPYDFSGRENIAVYRYHGSEVQEFTQLSALPESPVDLTCYLDTSNNYIYLYTSNFSEYAIGYDTIPVAASTDSDTSGTSSSTGSSTAAAEESTVTLIPLPLFKKDASPDTGDHAVPAGIVLTALILLLIVKFFLNGYETRIGLTDKRKSESIKKWAVWIKNGRNRERRLNVAVVCVGTHVLVCLIRKRIYNRMIVFRERTE